MDDFIIYISLLNILPSPGGLPPRDIPLGGRILIRNQGILSGRGIRTPSRIERDLNPRMLVHVLISSKVPSTRLSHLSI
jgi:hypothetical protein